MVEAIIDGLVDKFQGFVFANGATIEEGSNLYLDWFTKQYEEQELSIRLEAVVSKSLGAIPGFILEVRSGSETMLKVRAKYGIEGPYDIKTETYIPGTWEQKNL